MTPGRIGKGASDERLTYLLRPNVTRPSKHVTAALETPPVTDLDSSTFEYESDLVSDRDFPDAVSDVDDPTHQPTHLAALATIAELSVPGTPHIAPTATLAQKHDVDLDSWSVVSDDALADIETDDSADEMERVSDSVVVLSLNDTDRLPRADPRIRNVPLRAQIWERQRRSASSPSRSPARRLPSRPIVRKELRHVDQPPTKSFYEYLFT